MTPFVFVVFAVLVVIWLLGRLMRSRRLRVDPHTAAVVFRRDGTVDVRDPGVSWLRWGERLDQTIDRRLRSDAVSGQEVPTRDAIAVRISMSVRYRVVDPLSAVSAVESYKDALYLDGQLRLRAEVATRSHEELLEQRDDVATAVTTALAQAATAYGVDVEAVDVRDVVLPGDLKRSLAEVAVAQAQARGELERARGETAVLRHLANAAKLLETNPALYQLRVLQTLGRGSTLVAQVEDPSRNPKT